MKIGKFASKNNVTIDTIRHYMDLGLIIPEKLGGHYDFDDRCQEDFKGIVEFKDMGFTLNEIKSIFMFKRLGKLNYVQERAYRKSFFEDKYNDIKNKIRELNMAKIKLEKKIEELSIDYRHEKFKIGVSLNIISNIKCIKCGGKVVLHKGEIYDNQIINGVIQCRNCSNIYKIEDGILFTEEIKGHNKYNGNLDIIKEYMDYTALEYLENVYKGLEWTHRKIDFTQLENKIILELGTGIGFLLRYIYNDLPSQSTYISVDKDINSQRFLKSVLEQSSVKKNISFINGDFLNMPIANRSLDVIIDYSGTSNYSFDHEDFLLHSIDKLVKKDSYLIGAYILFDKFNFNSLIETKYRKNFILKNINQEIEKLNYKIIYQKIGDTVRRGGKYENYFAEGERVYTYIILGKR
ncbi:MerR family transcriptional regulator [Clostridiisalibacter paucivorans]|uniref:MerR family transcriptional regulator n=1 Tax=Clostridiisalibacter paucivorans TaxID=408753 RepID=UPI00047B119A|nr:MerR family transcriptional regulator [Clostridiisalibacter paucivorans]